MSYRKYNNLLLTTTSWNMNHSIIELYSFKGITILSLAEGHPITDIVPEIPTHYPQDFQDFLTK